MNITIDAKALREALAFNVAEKRTAMPVLEHALLSAAGVYELGKLTLTTSNMEEQVSVVVPCHNEDGSELLVNAAELRNALSGLTGEVTLQLKDNKLTVQQKTRRGSRQFSLNHLAAADFPLYNEDSTVPFEIDPALLKTAITRVKYAASKKDVRYYLNAVSIAKNYVAATDGHRLAIFKLGSEISHELLVPIGCIDRLLKVLGRGEDKALKLYVNKDNKAIALAVVSDELNYIVKLMSGNYPDVFRTVPVGNPNSVVELNCPDVLPVIERDVLMETAKIKNTLCQKLSLNFNGNMMRIRGRATDDFADCMASNEADCTLDGKYLCDVLRLGGDDGITCEVFGEGKPLKFNFGGDDFHLIMPIRA